MGSIHQLPSGSAKLQARADAVTVMLWNRDQPGEGISSSQKQIRRHATQPKDDICFVYQTCTSITSLTCTYLFFMDALYHHQQKSPPPPTATATATATTTTTTKKKTIFRTNQKTTTLTLKTKRKQTYRSFPSPVS